jgi:hypothetical protein
MTDLNDPNHWRKRAAEMRELAERMRDPGVRNTVLKMAADYGLLAQEAEAALARAAKRDADRASEESKAGGESENR